MVEAIKLRPGLFDGMAFQAVLLGGRRQLAFGLRRFEIMAHQAMAAPHFFGRQRLRMTTATGCDIGIELGRIGAFMAVSALCFGRRMFEMQIRLRDAPTVSLGKWRVSHHLLFRRDLVLPVATCRQQAPAGSSNS